MMRETLHSHGLLFVVVVGFSLGAYAAGAPGPDAYPPDVVKYLQRINSVGQHRYAFREDYPGGFKPWQKEARKELTRLLGMEKIAAQAPDFEPKVEIGEIEDLGEVTRQLGTLETEPSVRIPFYLLKPKGDGPFPLGIFPHGHDARGHRTSAGVYDDAAHRARSVAQDRDVALQAAKRGYVAIAPAVRGLATDGVPDVNDRHGGRDCRSHLVHCLLAGRTAIGERLWDMQRFLDWALALPEVDSSHVLVMGNSGGGVVTLYTAACDTRVTVAVASCSFVTLTNPEGYIYHCDCDLVPGILEFGDLSDVAGLVAPRYLLTVNGEKDTLHSAKDVERAAAHVRAIYKAASVPTHYEHRWGDDGHRFYSDLMWPFIAEAAKR